MTATEISGVGYFPVTPFDSDDEVDIGVLRDRVRETTERGEFGAVFPLGSVGEFAYLTTGERKRVAEAAIEAADGSAPVFVGTHATATKTAVELSVHAQEAGADGVLVNMISYFRPDDGEILEHYRALDRALEIPILAYDNPTLTGVRMGNPLIQRITALDSVVGIKSGTDDLGEFKQLARELDDDVALFAAPPYVFEKVLAGAEGWSGGPVSQLAPEQAAELFDLARGGQLRRAREAFDRWQPLFDVVASESLPAVVKAALELQGYPVGGPRAPIQGLGAEHRSELEGVLDELGIL